MRTPGKRGTALERRPGVFLVQASHPSGRKVSKTVHVAGRYKPGTIPLEVQRELAALVASVDRDRDVLSGRSFKSVTAEWLDKTELAASTRYTYLRYLNRYIYPEFEDKDVGTITTLDLDEFYKGLRARLSVATVRQVHAIVRSILKAAVKWGYTGINVAVMVSPSGGKGAAQHEIVAPTREEVSALMAACGEDIDIRTFLVLSSALGTRRGETCALRWCNIDLEDGSVRVEASIDETPGQRMDLKSTKTHAVATLSIGPAVVEVLRVYRSHRELLAGALGRSLQPNTYVFSRDDAGSQVPWHPGYATHRFDKVRERAGLGPHVKLKNLRHFHATQLLSAGVDIRTVAGRLRHASATTTLQFYAKRDMKADRKAAEVWDNLI